MMVAWVVQVTDPCSVVEGVRHTPQVDLAAAVVELEALAVLGRAVAVQPGDDGRGARAAGDVQFPVSAGWCWDQLGEEGGDSPVDLVSDGVDVIDALADRVFQLPVQGSGLTSTADQTSRHTGPKAYFTRGDRSSPGTPCSATSSVGI